MSLTSQAGMWGFAPQNKKSTHPSYVAPTLWYRHKADAVTMGIMDDQRMGDPEVGGRPVPGFAYKAGAIVAGGAVITPRLEDTFGWLLFAALGDVDAPVAAVENFLSNQAFMPASTMGVDYAPHLTVTYVLQDAAPTTIDADLVDAPFPAEVQVQISALGGGNVAFTGDVTVEGTDVDDEVLTETITIAGAILNQVFTTVGKYKTVTEIVLPPREVADDAMKIGYAIDDLTLAADFDFGAEQSVFLTLSALGLNNAAFSGYVLVSGEDDLAAPAEEIFEIVAGELAQQYESTAVFALVDGIAISKAEVLGDQFSLGIASTVAVEHKFKLDDTVPSYVPWFAQRKYIPPMDGDLATDLGETYRDCKATGLMFTLPNEGLVKARLDTRGRFFELTDSASAWSWTNEFEEFDSIAIGSNEGSYIKIDNAAAGIYNLELPVIGASIGIMNTPLPIRQEKVFGSPYIRDVTIVDRRLTVDVAVQWENAELYRAVLTGAVDGLTWTAAPFSAELDIVAIAAANIPGTELPYMIRFQAPRVVLGLQGPITLAGSETVIMRFVGVALDNDEDYCLVTLRNAVTAYSWPA